ncbi:hypothetical protein G8A07_01835 [Roseateles sp. DAIF2]|uniref:hypothetical protein n=1 Tax=Roseateles sp. DAIF2 TaxID=2714952 RepID=UPI0018A29D47|nr:hypothetical protein [Roseateles sp. DAIF2]QPF71794.1 hypothetical protein G8A07_01835 [Roseateles sp. DAIF2]
MTPDAISPLPELPSLLGLTELDAPLIAAILAYTTPAAGAPVPTELSQKRKKEIRSGFVLLKEQGVVMAFSPREAHAADYGEPRGAGTQVLSGLFYYPVGSEEVEPYEGDAPFANQPIETRDEALAAYGAPSDGEADDDEDGFEWEQWQIDGRELSLDYDEDGTVLTITVALPGAM